MPDECFFNYLQLGWNHIIAVTAYDHLLFIITLCAVFEWKEWRKVLTIVTAFTIGHSLTLALVTFNFLPISSKLVELLIPVTIMITAIRNIMVQPLLHAQKTFDRKMMGYYCTALFFGLIHGMGFASSFKLMIGSADHIIKQLFAFNCGLELGQILIVCIFMLMLIVFSKLLKVKHREWNLFISGAGFGIACILLINVWIQ